MSLKFCLYIPCSTESLHFNSRPNELEKHIAANKFNKIESLNVNNLKARRGSKKLPRAFIEDYRNRFEKTTIEPKTQLPKTDTMKCIKWNQTNRKYNNNRRNHEEQNSKSRSERFRFHFYVFFAFSAFFSNGAKSVIFRVMQRASWIMHNGKKENVLT